MKKSPKLSSKACAAKTSEKALYLINDEYNTFEHVINCLVTICEHNELQAEQCAFLAHYKGSCEIAIGNMQDLILLQEDLALYGLDVEIF
ncbi:MAG: ATP-dependent Clp protease adaptor ClpS [Bacteroidota bacterium]|nr:ATP-dependent Clp protease adaptor ClpS [Bacteroidota bacterium]